MPSKSTKKTVSEEVFQAIGELNANVKNLNDKFVDIAKVQKDMGMALINISKQGDKILELEKRIESQEAICSLKQSGYIEGFGLIKENREEIRRDLCFLSNLRKNAEHTKRRFLSVIATKIAEIVIVYILVKFAAFGVNIGG